MDDLADHGRKTSTVRTDDGCEIVFVDELEILRRGRGSSHAVFAAAKWLLVVTPLLWLVVFSIESHRPDSRIGHV